MCQIQDWYQIGSKNFHPIDEEGQKGHNHYFTMETHGFFRYTKGKHFSISCADDCWVYINGIKVVDLGGIHKRMT